MHIQMLTRAQLPYLNHSVFTQPFVEFQKRTRTSSLVAIKRVVSTGIKSSSYTMGYVTGFFHLAPENKY